MSAEEVIEKILADARAEAEQITDKAKVKAAAQQAELDKQMDEYRKQSEQLAEKAGRDEKLHLLATARMEIAKEFLAEKRKILDEVFEQARTQLQNLPDDEYRKFMSKLMAEAAESGNEEVVIDKNEKRIDQALIDEVNNQLSSGSDGKLKLCEEKQDLGGGFILRHGKIKNNVSLKVLLAQARENLEIELAKELFEK